MSDDVMQEIVGKIADMALSGDHEDPNTQWRAGYEQACNDIVLMVCRVAAKHRSVTVGLPEAQKTL